MTRITVRLLHNIRTHLEAGNPEEADFWDDDDLFPSFEKIRKKNRKVEEETDDDF